MKTLQQLLLGLNKMKLFGVQVATAQDISRLSVESNVLIVELLVTFDQIVSWL